MRVAIVALGAESLVIARIDPASADPTEASVGAGPESVFVAERVRRDGTVVELPTPWLRLPPRIGASSQSLGPISAHVEEDGAVVIASVGHAWRADQALTLLDGPVLFPRWGADARIAWEGSGEASIAWSVSPVQEGRATGQRVPRDVFLGQLAVGGGGVATRERVSQGRTVLALDRTGDEIGVVFESADRTFFASQTVRGVKRGGDVLLHARTTQLSTELEDVAIPDQYAAFARGGGKFSVVTLGAGELVTTEISCAP